MKDFTWILPAVIMSTIMVVNGFGVPSTFVATRSSQRQALPNDFRRRISLDMSSKKKKEGEVGSGPNWIERSFPVDLDKLSEGNANAVKGVEDYDLGISGVSYQTGPLSQQMYDAMVSNIVKDEMSEEIMRAYKAYAMDFTAKEATKAALKQNGLEIVLGEDDEDMSMWGDVDAIQLLDIYNKPIAGRMYDSVEEAIDEWKVGQAFNFVARQVPAEIKKVGLDELLTALDPDGVLRKKAKERNMTLPDEDITSLLHLANDCVRRTETAPYGAKDEAEAFIGKDKRGYRVISRSDLLRDSVNADGSESQKTLMHVMNAFVNHGALVVDVTDGGTTFKLAKALNSMWAVTENFFKSLDENSALASSLPGMGTAEGAGSVHCKVGFASYKNASTEFLETRSTRDGTSILPNEVQDILGSDGTKALQDAFDLVCDVGKDTVRIATAASSVEAGAFGGMQGESEASYSATRMADELIDDAKSLDAQDIIQKDVPVSMSPHRLCRYTNNGNVTAITDESEEGSSEVSRSAEIFGAHTDSSFITAVPVAAVSGLEVFDEEADLWFRPELMARKHWQKEREQRKENPDDLFETISGVDGSEDTKLPWHARYIVIIPGEFLQLTTRNEVPAAVHRVVAVDNGPSRLSAPILLRGRPGTKLDVQRYLGNFADDPLLKEVDGKSMEEIHDAMQPSSFQ